MKCFRKVMVFFEEHFQVLNQGIAELEKQSFIVVYWFHVIPTGDLSYQSKGTGYQESLVIISLSTGLM